MELIAANLGPLLLGILLNTYLYGIVTHQYLSYYNTKFRDPLWIKATVLALFILDSFHSFSLIYLAWHFMITGFENPIILSSSIWPYPLSAFINVITASLTHLFLSYRVLRLTNKYIYLVLLFLSLGSCAAGILCGVKAWVIKGPSMMFIANPYLSVWLSLEVATDISISATLSISLASSRTGFCKSDAVINRLMRTSIQTGAFSGIFAILTLACYIGLPQTQCFALFALPVGRLYTNSLMNTLLCREDLRGLLSQGEVNESTIKGGNIHLKIHKEIHTDVLFADDQLTPKIGRFVGEEIEM